MTTEVCYCGRLLPHQLGPECEKPRVRVPEGFFYCGFCKAVAPEGQHVCGDHFTQQVNGDGKHG